MTEETKKGLWVMFLLFGSFTGVAYGYSGWYMRPGNPSAYVSDSHIEGTARPIDCDFGTAPLGDKGCSYEKQVQLLNAKGEIIGGDEVLPNGDHVKTYPRGPVTDATVAWIKINDEEAFVYNHQKAIEAERIKSQVHQDPKVVADCVARLKSKRNDPDASDEQHMVNACTYDPSIGNRP